MKYIGKIFYILLICTVFPCVFSHEVKAQSVYPNLVFREEFDDIKRPIYTKKFNGWKFYSKDVNSDLLYNKNSKAIIIKNLKHTYSKFIKEFIVKKDHFYYLSVMIRTDNVIKGDGEYDVGANIGDDDEYYPSASESMIGTTGWTRVGVIIPPKKKTDDKDSGDKQSIERRLKIALRLGHYKSKVSGKAWFKDVRIYDLGSQNDIRNNPTPEPTTWKVLGIICENVNSKELVSQMTKEQIEASKNAFLGYKKMLEEWSKGYLKIDLKVNYSPIPLRHTSHSEKYKLVASEKDISEIVELMATPKEYDSILVSIPIPLERVEGYAGLTFLTRIYSKNIRTYYSMFTPYNHFTKSLQDDLKITINMMFDNQKRDYILSYSYGIVIHEWLHQVEYFYRNNLGFDEIPVLHAHEKYGYNKDYKWYRDFIGFDVINPETGRREGVPPGLWKLTPRMF